MVLCCLNSGPNDWGLYVGMEFECSPCACLGFFGCSGLLTKPTCVEIRATGFSKRPINECNWLSISVLDWLDLISAEWRTRPSVKIL